MDAYKKKLFYRAVTTISALVLTAALQAHAQVTNMVSPNGTTSFIINGQSNPTIPLTRGVTYVFQLNGLSIHPFHIKTNLTTGTANDWTNGVINNGSTSASVIFTVPTTPLPPALTNTLFYHCGNHATMGGLLPIVDPPPGPQLVKIVYISVSNNIVIQSLGTNTWSVTPLCSPSLTTSSSNWTAVPNFSNTFNNGTNITTFGRTNVDAICGPNNPAFFQIRQQFP